MENHIWNIIVERIKHNRTLLDIKGGNNPVKNPAKRRRGLGEAADKLRTGRFDRAIAGQ